MDDEQNHWDHTYIGPFNLSTTDFVFFSPMSFEKSKPVMRGMLFSSNNTFDGLRFK
jgi:hypothetical protein